MPAQNDLFLAAARNDVALVKQALDEGADINGMQDDGSTALIIAVKHQASDILLFLLRAGAEIALQDNQQRTVVHWVLLQGSLHLFSLLLQEADITDVLRLKDNTGKTPLDLAGAFPGIYPFLPQAEALDYHGEVLMLRKALQGILDAEDIPYQAQDYIKCLSPLPAPLQTKLQALAQQILQPEDLLHWEETGSLSKAKAPALSSMMPAIRAKVLTETLTPQANLFKKIKALLLAITEIEALLKHETWAYPVLNSVQIQLLRAKAFYTTFIDMFCQAQGEKRLSLCEGRFRICSYWGSHYVNDKVNALFVPLWPALGMSSAYLPGNHQRIVRFGSLALKLHPIAPSVGYAVTYLQQVIAGQGAVPHELCRIEKGDRYVPLQVVKAPEGKTLLSHVAEASATLALDGYDFSLRVALALLTCPQADSADNFIVVTRLFGSGHKQRLTLTALDTDCAFGEPIYSLPQEGPLGGQHYPGLKTVLFTFPQMDKPISARFRQVFLQHSPLLLLLKWLKGLWEEEQRYVSDKPSPLKDSHLPLRLPVGTLQTLYTRFCMLQQLLQAQPAITHQALLSALYPLLGLYYAELRRSHPSLAAAKRLFEPSATFENVCAAKRDALSELIIHPSLNTQPGQAPSETLLDACTGFIEHIHYAAYTPALQRHILTSISQDFSFLQKIVIRHCPTLTDEDVALLSQRASSLKSVQLHYCLQIDGQGLSALLCRHPHVHLVLEGLPRLTTVNVLHLLQYQAALTFIIADQPYDAQKAQNALLKAALQMGDNALITALLIRGAHLQAQTGTTALHLACAQANQPVVTQLLYYGSNVNARDEKGESALDIVWTGYQTQAALKPVYEAILFTLWDNGAIACHSPKALFDWVLAHQPLTPSRQALLWQFGLCHQLIAPEQVAQLLPSQIESLSLQAPPDFAFAKLVLDSKLVLALQQHLPALKHIDIATCEGMSPALLSLFKGWPQLSRVEMTLTQAIACQLLTQTRLHEASKLHYEGITIAIMDIQLSQKAINQTSLLQVGTVLRKTAYLKSLSLPNGSLTETALTCFAGGLKTNTSLTEICLNHNPALGDKGVMHLLLALVKHPHLAILSLDNTQAGEQSASQLALLLTTSTALTSLSLYNNPLGNAGVKALAQGLQARPAPALQKLNLNQVRLGDEGMIALTHALLSYPLAFLDIGYNPAIGKAGGEALIRLLEQQHGLKICLIHGIGFTAKLEEQIKALLQANQALYHEQKVTRLLARVDQHYRHSTVFTPLNPAKDLSLDPLLPISTLSQPEANQNHADIPKPIPALQPTWGVAIPYQDLTCEDKIGEGVFACVYKGTCLYYGEVAIKVFKPQSETGQVGEEFKQEAFIMASVRSPYIVNYFGACLEAAHPALVMEYLPKGNLYRYLHNPENVLPVSLRYQWMLEISRGMAYLHSYGIVHGDFKSPNVLLDTNLRAKIADFGQSKLQIGTTHVGVDYGGTLYWLAPELLERLQLQQGRAHFSEGTKTTYASDMYSFGMVLWEIESRNLPYQTIATNPIETFKQKICQERYREPLPAETSVMIKDIIQLCWFSQPKARPTARAVLTMLEAEKEELYSQPKYAGF